MKKVNAFALSLFLLTAISCGDSKKEEEQLNKTLDKIEAVEKEVDNTIEEVEKKAKEVESVIDELDNL